MDTKAQNEITLNAAAMDAHDAAEAANWMDAELNVAAADAEDAANEEEARR